MAVLSILVNTFRETIRDRILYNLLFFALGLIILSMIVSNWSMAEEVKILKDFGLSILSLFGVLMTIFIGISLVYKEVDKRTLYVILSRPINRYHFILGKYSGLMVTLGINIVLMTLGLYVVLYFFEVSIDWSLWKAVLLIYAEMMVLMSFAILFSSFTTPTLSAMFSLFIYISGHLSSDIIFYESLVKNYTLKNFLTYLHFILPNLENFNIKSQVVHKLPLEPNHILFALLYGLVYTAVVIGVAIFIFQKRDFK